MSRSKLKSLQFFLFSNHFSIEVIVKMIFAFFDAVLVGKFSVQFTEALRTNEMLSTRFSLIFLLKNKYFLCGCVYEKYVQQLNRTMPQNTCHNKIRFSRTETHIPMMETERLNFIVGTFGTKYYCVQQRKWISALIPLLFPFHFC